MRKLQELWQNLSDKSRKTFVAIAVGTAVIAIIAVLILRFGMKTDYSTLFTGLNQEEAQEVVALLQEDGIDYRFKDKEGAIQVPASTVDQTRAELLGKGYPQSGFAYDMYRNNAGLMTTESDKKQYTLYELQDRLGAQIRLFDGVRDAKVTIAESGEQKYALQDQTSTDASASVVVTMENGRTLSSGNAAAIKNLISHCVRGMNFTNVSVFDAESMIEVGGSSTDDTAFGSAKDLTSLTSLIESNISGNIRRVLEQIYGQGTVAVSVKGTLNMEKLIQENTQYTTPEKMNEEDKTGLLQNEDVTNEDLASTGMGAGGVAGADANADTPRYTNQDNTQAAADGYTNSSATREWLYNSVKEQRVVDPGVLENTTVGIVINTEDTTVSNTDLVNLVANSAGILREAANEKITIVRVPSPYQSVTASATPLPSQQNQGLPLSIKIAMAAGGILIVLLLILLLLGRKKRKKNAELLFENGDELFESNDAEGAPGDAAPVMPKTNLGIEARAIDEEMERNEEILNLRMQHSLKLKQNIGGFVDTNPQIAAKLIQSWLRGEGVEESGGNRRNDSTRKER